MLRTRRTAPLRAAALVLSALLLSPRLGAQTPAPAASYAAFYGELRDARPMETQTAAVSGLTLRRDGAEFLLQDVERLPLELGVVVVLQNLVVH